MYDALGRHADAAPFHKRALALREKAGRAAQTKGNHSHMGEESRRSGPGKPNAVAAQAASAR